MGAHLVVAEDDRAVRESVTRALELEGYVVTAVTEGIAALEAASRPDVDLLLLDLGMPNMDGLTVCRRLRSAGSRLPILVLTARTEVSDRVSGLDAGADDYLPKPFSLLELQSRMQAISRRKFNLNTQEIPLGEFIIDLQKRVVSHQSNEIDLTRKEFDLLSYLLLHKNRVLTRMQLSEHIWGTFADDDYDSNYIDVHIKNIRKKLGAFGQVEWLETVRGVGYKIRK